MQNLFITEDDVFEVKIFVAEDDEGMIYCDLNKEGVELLIQGKEYGINEYSITFKKPSFGDMIELTKILLSARMFNSDVTDYDVNPIESKLKTMSCLIKDWNFTDGNGGNIPATEENIRKLNPTIATAISLQLEDYLSPDEEPVPPPVPPEVEEVSETDVSIEKAE